MYNEIPSVSSGSLKHILKVMVFCHVGATPSPRKDVVSSHAPNSSDFFFLYVFDDSFRCRFPFTGPRRVGFKLIRILRPFVPRGVDCAKGGRHLVA